MKYTYRIATGEPLSPEPVKVLDVKLVHDDGDVNLYVDGTMVAWLTPDGVLVVNTAGSPIRSEMGR